MITTLLINFSLLSGVCHGQNRCTPDKKLWSQLLVFTSKNPSKMNLSGVYREEKMFFQMGPDTPDTPDKVEKNSLHISFHLSGAELHKSPTPPTRIGSLDFRGCFCGY